jgi:hypothetical protein
MSNYVRGDIKSEGETGETKYVSTHPMLYFMKQTIGLARRDGTYIDYSYYPVIMCMISNIFSL